MGSPPLRVFVLALLASACTPTPSVVLQFPDKDAESEGATFTVAALPQNADCAAAMASGTFTGSTQVLTGTLPLTTAAHLGTVPRGAAIFFAEVRDAKALPILRACAKASSGAEVVLVLERIGSALSVDEGHTLVATIASTNPDGSAVSFTARDLPEFASFDASSNSLKLSPGFADAATYTLHFDAAKSTQVGAVANFTVTLTVNDVPRPLVWNRLYRGWHGRFDAAALYDNQKQQLLVTGGRDVGIDLASPTLYTTSTAPDVLSDFHDLDLRSSPAVWNANTFVHSSSNGKYGHVMGFVKSAVSGRRMGFIIGGSDGAQVSPESLLLDPIGTFTLASAPFAVGGTASNEYFLTGMATAIEPDESATYLFGGDIGFGDFHNAVMRVSAIDDNELDVDEVMTSPLGRPAPRTQSATALALNPKRLVVIGGRSVTGLGEVHYSDAWVLCLEQSPPLCPQKDIWLQVQAGGDAFPGSGADGVFALSAAYDPTGNRVITYGGLGIVAAKAWLFEDAFALDLSASTLVDAGIVSGTWTKLPAPGGPYGLVGAASAIDTDGGRMLLYGGLTGRIVNGNPQLDITEDVWQLGLTAGTEQMTKLNATGIVPYPTRRVSASMTSRGDPLLFGGEGEGVEPTDEWVVRSDGGVESISLGGDQPLPRAQFDVVYNPDLDEYWCYGGRVGNLRPVAALWRLRTDAGFTEVDQELDIDPRFGQATIYDQGNHRLLTFGGIAMNGSLNDIQTVTLSGDTVVTDLIVPDAGATPDPRYGMVSGYDRAGQRLVFFGGTKTVSGSEIDTNEVWQLSLVAGHERWSQIVATGPTPEPMYLPVGILTKENPPALYVLGTVNRPPLTQPMFIDQMWKLTLTPGAETWSIITLPDFRPKARLFPTTVYDAIGHRMLMTSGAQDPVFRNDVWALTLP